MTECAHSTNWDEEAFFFQDKKIDLQFIHSVIDSYFATLGTAGSDQHKSAGWHARRYFMTLSYIAKYELYKGIIFEAGGEGIFSHIFKLLFSPAQMIHIETDLRDPIEIKHETIDTILLMEVFEHINDVNKYHEFAFEGIRLALESCWNMLKDNGRIILTTPNMYGVLSLNQILRRKNALMYPCHVREYTSMEIKEIALDFGFEVDILATEYVFIPYLRDGMLKILAQSGFSTEDRGDDIVAILRKPEGGTFNSNASVSDLILRLSQW